jgi:8-oxo-dGTP pyrophosphatase MutT (NUDIX family)
MMDRLDQTVFTIEMIQEALAKPLPGITAQKRLAPQPTTGKYNRWHIPEDCRQASVLLLLYPYSCDQPEFYLALTRRPEYPGAHSGQISLPGGRREGPESLQQTALRETTEEIGVLPEVVEVIGQLSPLYTPPSNFCIYPFVGFSCTRPAFQVNPREVAELIEAPLNLFLKPEVYKEEIWSFQNLGERQIPFFDVFGHKVWGATAMILSEFLALLAQ